jgi:hypothetical protein
MPEQVNRDYEVSSESAVRHWEIPYTRLHDQTPTPTNPAQVTSTQVGTEMTGTVLSIDAVASMAVIDFTHSMVYWQEVRTVVGYNIGVAENAWQALNIGDTVYYDDSVGMPAGVKLSVAPANLAGVANPVFGHIVPGQALAGGGFDTDAATYPKAAGAAGNNWWCAVMQEGA